ncbi:hypothetical protein PanWU01x14_298130 [Parasponia andersonii]|uniref:Uncharacterized protein n=1 Tax=Parasponia andersonii TaxID=3476 RepID=A0A2P5AUU7_PARAD|nr:hypothetical protein PanWU01x14_298130 [Parasponia andersonii]
MTHFFLLRAKSIPLFTNCRSIKKTKNSMTRLCMNPKLHTQFKISTKSTIPSSLNRLIRPKKAKNSTQTSHITAVSQKKQKKHVTKLKRIKY